MSGRVVAATVGVVVTAGLWTSREMADTEDREIVVRTNLRELIVYLVFLTVVSIRECSQHCGEIPRPQNGSPQTTCYCVTKLQLDC